MSSRHCFQCEAQNPSEQSYCGQCGASLVLKDYIAAQVSRAIAESPRDREALIKADAVEVFEKAFGWAKLTAEILLIPVIAVIGLLGWLGLREFNLSKTAMNAQHQIENTTIKARGDISQASANSIGEVQKESGKAIDASRNSEATAARLSTDLKITASKAKTEVNGEASDVRTEVAKSKTELQEVHNLQPEFDTMRGQLAKATSDLAAQQKVISSSEDFVKHVFSTHVTYTFSFKDFVQPNAIVIPAAKSGGQTIVMMLVPDTPIEGTLQLQYKIYTQPVNSYIHFHNLIIFFWGDPPENLKTDALYVTFFPDKSDKETIKTLTTRDGRVYADDQPFPKFGQPDPDWKGNKWMLAQPPPQPAKP